MHKNATKCNETLSKWCKNKHGASKIIDTFEMYQSSRPRRHFPLYAKATRIKRGRATGGVAIDLEDQLSGRIGRRRARRKSRWRGRLPHRPNSAACPLHIECPQPEYVAATMKSWWSYCRATTAGEGQGKSEASCCKTPNDIL
jgi:hypothetical protein